MATATKSENKTGFVKEFLRTIPRQRQSRERGVDGCRDERDDR